MFEKWQHLLDTLQTLPVDTAEQQALVKAAMAGAKDPAILVAGAEESDPFSLLPGVNPFEGAAAPACPVWCRHAETFSVLVQNRQDENERFHTAADYRAVYGHQPQQVKACTVYTPYAEPSWPPLLFVVPAENDAAQWRTLAALADGCIFTVQAEAGTVGEAAVGLSHLMPQSRAALVLTHVENTFYPNDMLTLQLYGGRLVCMECDHTLPGAGGPMETLRNAMELICSASADRCTETIITKACQDAAALMDAHVQGAQAHYQQLLKAVAQAEEAERTFRAMASSRRYEVRAMVKEDHIRWMQQDFTDLAEALKQQLPAMISEVTDSCENPKEALKNLLADYVSSTLNTAMTAALDHLTQTYYAPEIRRIMQNTQDDYARVTSVALNTLQSIDADTSNDFMHLVNLHIGDFHTPFASFLSDKISNLLFWTLFRYELFFAAGVVSRLETLLEDLLSDVLDKLMPTQLYASSVGKAVIGELDKIQGELVAQIPASVFPRLTEVLDKEYDAFIDECARQLVSAADRLRQKAQDAQTELERCEQAAAACRQAM